MIRFDILRVSKGNKMIYITLEEVEERGLAVNQEDEFTWVKIDGEWVKAEIQE